MPFNFSSYGDDLETTGLLRGGTEGFIRGLEAGEDAKMKSLEHKAKLNSMETEVKRHAEQQAIELRKAGLMKDAQGQIVDDPAARQRADIEKGVGSHQRPQYGPDGKLTGYELDPKYAEHEIAKAKAAASFDPFGGKAAGAQKAKIDAETAIKEASRKTKSPIKGYEKSDDYVGTPEEEKHLRTAKSETDKFNGIMDGLQARVKSASIKDLANPWSSVSKDIQNDLRDLQLIYKGPAFAQLGVLAGPDMKILDQILEDPGSISNLAQSLKSGNNDNVIGRFKQAQDRVNAGFRAKTESLGLVQPGLVTPQGLTAGALLPPKGKVTVTKGNETLVIPEADLKAAIKDGYKQVK